MKVKTFYARNASKLDKKVNDYLAQEEATIVDVKYSINLIYFSAMIIMNEK